ncbi:hypothetical protein N431DRAFT_377881 [Stipitochalara longipes BDJ]|nr:hypothetical protein N431DRAFT_377881 [Stipitochalara longipes BDJ]
MESTFRLSASAPQGTHEYAPRYTSDEWESVKHKVRQLYVQEQKTLQEVMYILEHEGNIAPSEKQLKSRISKWGFDVKNVKGDIMLQMVRTRVKRKRNAGKNSAFRVNKKPVVERKINRYLKRNNVSEEDLLSMPSPLNAPSPAFSVFTPRPDSPSDTWAEIAHIASGTANISTASITSGLKPDSGTSEADTMSFHHASDPQNTGAVAKFCLKGSAFGFSSLPRHIQDRPESPEVLLWHFREQICPMLAMTDGENNMWRTLVLPLVQSSQSLYHSIAAMTALHASTDRQLHIYGTRLMGQSLVELNYELQGPTIDGMTIATILILAYWARWNQGSNTGKIHVDGAIAALRLLQSRAPEVTLRSLPDDKSSLMTLLSDTCVYMDSLSRLVSSASAVRGYKFSSDAVLEGYFGQTLHPTPHPTDPWMYCAGSLFPLMNWAADLCYAARMGLSHILLVFVGDAVSLRLRLENWVPNTEFGTSCRVNVSVLDAEYIIHTAEAYRYAIILYLQQTLPELPGMDIQEVMREVFDNLSIVPSSSTITFVQIFPLFVAGCEANKAEDRRWVGERWAVMIARMRVRNVSKCWEITQEVWRRRDLYRLISENAQWMADDGEDSDVELTVMGKLHWAQVMREWDWEVSF